MAVHDRIVRLLHGTTLPKFPQFPRCLVALGQEHDSGGFAVEPVDHVNVCLAKVQSHAADQAAVFVALGRVADEVGRLVDHEQLVVFMHEAKQFLRRPAHSGTVAER